MRGVFSLLVVLVSGCRADVFIPADEFANKWWLLEDHKITFYLESPTDLTYWSWGFPYKKLTSNHQDGDWQRVAENEFRISMLGGSWDVEAHENPERPGCYDVNAVVLGWPVHDIACRTERKEPL